MTIYLSLNLTTLSLLWGVVWRALNTLLGESPAYHRALYERVGVCCLAQG